MFKAIHHTDAARTFQNYADAYRFVMREGSANRLWQIVAAAPEYVVACRLESEAFRQKATA